MPSRKAVCEPSASLMNLFIAVSTWLGLGIGLGLGVALGLGLG